MASYESTPLETSPTPTQQASIGPVGGLSTSEPARLAAAYPAGPFSSDSESSTVPNQPNIVKLDGVTYRYWFQENVLNGKTPWVSTFASQVDMDYQSAPNIKKLSGPEDEPKPGSDGSTIVKSGIGPNVNVQSLNKDKKLVMVDPSHVDAFGTKLSTTPFVGDGSASPSETSPKAGKVTLGSMIKGVSG